MMPRIEVSSSSSEESYEDLNRFDEEELEDEERFDSARVCSLFDYFKSSSSNDIWSYMKKVFGFDLNEIKKNIVEFDDFKRIALINFLRRKQANGEMENNPREFIKMIPELINEWNTEANLIPVIPNDRLLWELPGNYEDSETDGEERQFNNGKNNNKEEQRKLEENIIFLNNELNKMKDFLTKLEDGTNQRIEQETTNNELMNDNKVRIRNQEDIGLVDKHNDDRTLKKLLDSDHHYFESYSHLMIHREMILDAPRTSAYEEFIHKASHLLKDKIVLDVGCGCGILLMFCSRAGAKLAVGVDAASDILKTATKIIHSSKFTDDQIQLLNGKVEEIDIWFESEGSSKVIAIPRGTVPPPGAVPFRCDVIVSEWMGYALLYEAMLYTVIDARDRFLVEGGMIIPSKACMQIWAADYSIPLHQVLDIWDARLYNLDLSSLKPDEDKFLKSPEVTSVDPKWLRSEPCTFLELDIGNVTRKELKRIRRPFKIQIQGEATSVALSFFCLFEGPEVKTVKLDTSPLSTETHWRQTVCHLMTDEKKRLPPLSNNSTISGFITLVPGSENFRHLTIVIELDAIKGSCINQPSINTFELK